MKTKKNSAPDKKQNNPVIEKDKKLTEDQQKAVQHFKGPAIVVAGPGSGKTRVIIERVRFLVESKKINPSRIAVTTFTEKTSGELKNRLSKDLGQQAAYIHVSTIHSLCRYLLETVYPYHDLGVAFNILSTEDQELLINAQKSNWKLLGRQGWREPLWRHHQKAPETAVAELYNLMTSNAISSRVLIKELEKTSQITHDLQRVIESYDYYCAYKTAEKLVDFDELLRKVFNILQNNRDAANILKSLFDYYLIDEYQDTDPVQDRIFNLLTEAHRNLFVVGDVNQSIYGFRGATIENFRAFKEHYPAAKEYFLIDNFRSTRNIVQAANTLLEKDIVKKLQAKREQGDPVILIKGTDRDQSINLAVSHIKELKQKGIITSYGDIAVLCRTNRLGSLFMPFLEREDIPYICLGNRSYFEQDEIHSLIYFLSYVFQHDICGNRYKEWMGWWRVVEFTGKVFGLSDNGREALEHFTGSLPTLLSESDLIEIGLKNPADIKKVLDLNSYRKDLETNKIKATLLEALYEIFKITGYLKVLVNINDEKSREILLNIARFTELVGNYSDSMKRPGIIGLLNFLHEKTKYERTDKIQIEDSDSLKIMTVHKSKGLEFPLVIIPGLTENSFPSSFQGNKICAINIPDRLLMQNRHSDPELIHYYEELRLFYVALTRAQDDLILLTSDIINTNKAKESSFLNLIMGHITEEINALTQVQKTYNLPEKIHQLSFSALNTYQTCPFLYWLIYEIGFKTPEIYTQRMGIIIHNVFQMINNDLIDGKKVSRENIRLYIDKYWLTITTSSKEKAIKEKFIKQFELYLKKMEEMNLKPVKAEKPFSFVGDRVIIKGKIDLLARKDDDSFEIIDFKATSKEGIEPFRIMEQLNLYRICSGEEDVTSLSAYTFYDNEFVPVKIDDKILENHIAKSINGIRDGNSPRKLDSDLCMSGNCPFKIICKE